MMQFGTTRAHLEMLEAIRNSLKHFGIIGLRADDKEYHEDLFPNVQTYMHGCGFGIALFERLQSDDFNPNVSLEVGYMRALRKPVCLMKDETLRTLPTDLVGKLYKSFDPQRASESIPTELTKWLHDREIVT
jgi:nucleoside 2-deoxyribosyltransferase